MDNRSLALTIEKELDLVIEFINMKHIKDINQQNKLINKLMDYIMQLDARPAYPNRKETIVAIQNIISQLENMFSENNKAQFFLQQRKTIRTSYLPKNRDSLYALSNSFQQQ